MDDITPTMDWTRFWRYIELFKAHHIKPLLGVVPDNGDPKLRIDRENPDFWRILSELVSVGSVQIAQHGYRHVYETRTHGILGKRYGFAANSEFAGLPYEVQLDKIVRGQRILEDRGIPTDVWMAPSHSFDYVTLRALNHAGFRAVTDGVALYPYREENLVFVPQQLWAPKDLPIGVWTICLHANIPDDALFEAVRRHVESSAKIVSFAESRELATHLTHRVANVAFKALYAAHIWRHRLRESRRRR